MTTPRTRTVSPTGMERADAMVMGAGVGVVDGAAVWAGVGAGVPGAGVGVVDGAAVWAGVLPGEDAGVDVGLGAGTATSSSPPSVAWIRYPAAPVPVLSRWPNGPRAVTRSPVRGMAVPSASEPAMILTGPVPSSTVTPSPSASSPGASTTVPVTSTRSPSSGSEAAPVEIASGSGSVPVPSTRTADGATRIVRSPYRVSRDPPRRTTVPAGIGSGSAESRYTAIPASGSWMNPVRPDSRAPSAVVRTPSTTTKAPSASARADWIPVIWGVPVGSGVTAGLIVGDGTGSVGSGVGWVVGDGLGDAASLGSGVGSADGVDVGPGVGSTGVATGVGVALGAPVGVGTGVADGAAVGVGLGVGDSAGLGVGDGVGLGVGDGIGLGVGDGIGLGVGDDASGTGGEVRFCATGEPFTTRSAALSFVSVTLPPGPPGSRSSDDPAGGAAPALPSTNELVASPHATASIGDPPIWRSTIAPPVAASPPE
jgi:hypothetical protein